MRTFVPVYVPRASPLHAAGPGATAALCFALALVCVLFTHPLILAAVLLAVPSAATAAGVGYELTRPLPFLFAFGALVALINPLVYNGGLTVLIRGDVFLGHRFDVTLEALLAGGLAGLRVIAFGLCFALFSACVDQDKLLGMLRRVSHRSALTAVLATRLVPVLARDAGRMGDAARCRPTAPGRLEVTRAALSGALERAVDVAAALEVRGYSNAVRPARRPRRWSRHDVRVTGAALLLAGGAIVLRAEGAGEVQQYPTFSAPIDAGALACCLVVLAAAALPFAGRGARLGVAAHA